MTEPMLQKAQEWPLHARLEQLLDKLVAVQLDLNPLCGTTADTARAAATPNAIAAACEILQSAVADLRDLIYEVEGLVGQ